jgi:hypothetical protein
VVDLVRMHGTRIACALAIAGVMPGCYEGLEPLSADTEDGSGTQGDGNTTPGGDGGGPAGDGNDDGDSGTLDGGPGDGASADGASADGASADGASADGASADGASADGAEGSSGDPMADDGADGGADPEVVEMCTRWTADRADLDEGAWSGSVGSCQPGDISAAGRANALRLVNLYRWLADLPEVVDEGSRNAGAQACALIMHANGALDHSPPSNWACWSSQGNDAAGSSNISTGQGVMSVDMYMVDFGNASTLGHRRWILSNSLGPIGLGSTSDSSCMWVIGGSGDAGAAWTAYPPPGPFPIEAVDPLPFGDNLDLTGWSIQSDALDLSGAQVTITEDGAARPVAITVLGANYGSASAISIIPQGWAAQAGATYHVEVAGVGAAIAYDVEMVDCGAI